VVSKPPTPQWALLYWGVADNLTRCQDKIKQQNSLWARTRRSPAGKKSSGLILTTLLPLIGKTIP